MYLLVFASKRQMRVRCCIKIFTYSFVSATKLKLYIYKCILNSQPFLSSHRAPHCYQDRHGEAGHETVVDA